MRAYKEEITKICKYASQYAIASGVFYTQIFIDPDNWELVCFAYDWKKQYIVWNKFFWGGWQITNDSDCPLKFCSLPTFIQRNFASYDNYVGNTPDEALEKWVSNLFDGKESLSSVRLHIDIAGIS